MIHGLFIGNNYPGTSSALFGCVNDAKDSAAEWGPMCATSKVLTNNKADRANVFKEGKKFLERLEPGDLGLISISGHGSREKSGSKWIEAIVFADFELGYDYEWAGLLNRRVRGSFLAVFADCCFSQGFARGNSPLRKSIPISLCQKHKHAKPAERDRALPDVNYFSACLVNEYAYDGMFDNRPEGAMTHYLRQSWRELWKVRKADLTPLQLFRKLATYLPDEEYNQTPAYIGSDRNMRRKFSSFAKAA